MNVNFDLDEIMDMIFSHTSDLSLVAPLLELAVAKRNGEKALHPVQEEMLETLQPLIAAAQEAAANLDAIVATTTAAMASIFKGEE